MSAKLGTLPPMETGNQATNQKDRVEKDFTLNLHRQRLEITEKNPIFANMK